MLSRKKVSGFTLIELLIVIAIIGILSSVVLVSLSSAREKSRDAAAISTMQSLRTVVRKCLTEGKTLTNVTSCNSTSPTVGASICGDAETWPNIPGYSYGQVCFSTPSSQYWIRIQNAATNPTKVIICNDANANWAETWFGTLVTGAQGERCVKLGA